LCVPLLLYRRHCGGTLPPQAPRARLLNHNNYKSNCSKSMSSSTHSSIITLLTMVLCCYCYRYPKGTIFQHPSPSSKTDSLHNLYVGQNTFSQKLIFMTLMFSLDICDLNFDNQSLFHEINFRQWSHKWHSDYT
jgi:hypothetical protein